MKILIADDSKTYLSLISTSLAKMGHEVVAVNSGQQAIDTFQINKPDLIILDVMMEGIDGFECAKRIREINSNEWIPIIFLSASVDDSSIAKGIDAGGDDYLIKPCSEITLEAKIKAMERISNMRQKLFDTTAKLYLLSSTDSLTGVYNRFQFERSINEILLTAERYKFEAAILFIDLDNFKGINDTFGHHIGDLLLIEVTNRIKTCLRANDFFARLGGDEFAIILSEIKQTVDAEEIARTIISTLSCDYQLNEHSIRTGASIGIAYYPVSAKSQEELVQCADLAMYHAKNSGRNNFKSYTPDLKEKYKQHLNLEHALKFALEKNELSLLYQPIFNLKNLTLVGMETLVTWDHPKYGLVSPNIFIPIAEETGMIENIGEWILHTAFLHTSQWPISEFKTFKLALNISACQLHQKQFYDRFLDLVKSSKLTEKNIELELTETVLMTYKSGSFEDTISKLHDRGISISIDDFGTGYSSLNRLKHLPFNTLKIEKSFIQDAVLNANSAIIVQCLIALGSNLKMNVIAEGIETVDQLNFLINNGCQQGQGFYLSKPLNITEATKFIKEEIKKQKKIYS
jgi:diguanylate cyclase (GGDEF)-like protein